MRELLVVLFLIAIVMGFSLIVVINVTHDTTVASTPVEFEAVVGTFNGHSYVHFTSYPMAHTVLHDPDCPCRLKAEQE